MLLQAAADTQLLDIKTVVQTRTSLTQLKEPADNSDK